AGCVPSPSTTAPNLFGIRIVRRRWSAPGDQPSPSDQTMRSPESIANRRKSRPHPFSSAPTVPPIPFVDALTHDRLVHLALDCDVLAIDIAEIRVGRSLPVRVIVAQRPDGLYAQDIEAVRADSSHAAVERLHD